VLEFTEPLDASSTVPESVAVQVWSLKRSANYGSKHFDERELAVQSVKLSDDGKRVELSIPDIAPAWSMEIRYQFRTATGQPATGVIHNTIHNLR
jgi:hypothetical protein